MLKKRIIFTLLVEDGDFVLSRNFSLQKVGNLEWIKDFYDFDSIATSIDELVILDVSRNDRDIDQFCALLRQISSKCYLPISAGGGIRSKADVARLLNSGSDKIVINTLLYESEDLVRELVGCYGSQCFTASIDCMRDAAGTPQVYVHNGSYSTGFSLSESVLRAQNLGVGELFITSINQDGTGRGLDLDLLDDIGSLVSCPVILSGGAGTFSHLADPLNHPAVSGVATANLFAFMGDNLTQARSYVSELGIQLASWTLDVRSITES